MYKKQILRFKEVCELTSLARSTIYTRLNPKSTYFDPSFPKPLPYGPRLVCFDKALVDKWIAKQLEIPSSDHFPSSITG